MRTLTFCIVACLAVLCGCSKPTPVDQAERAEAPRHAAVSMPRGA
jgi:ABC-type uncharacterized transport system auxiliary subunit